MDSYRASHVGEGTGTRYDASLSRKVDGIVWEELVKPVLLSTLRAQRARGAVRYLDFACGTGRILEVGASVFEDVTGIDVSPDMLEVARERVPQAKIVRADVTRDDIGSAAAEFDCVTMFRFLLNAEPALRREVLQWIAAHMRPGAILIGNNHMAAASLNGLATQVAEALAPRSRNHMSRATVEALLRDTGFRIDSWRGFRVLPSFRGRPILGRNAQLAAEKVAMSLGLDRFGSDQLFIAYRI